MSRHKRHSSTDISGFVAAKAFQERGSHFSGNPNLTKLLLARMDELKHALDELERSLLGKHLGYCPLYDLEYAPELARALYQLSASRVGAMIAIEREMSLEDHAKSGTRVDAELSMPLLLSVFYPGNPLHDGAAIVRGNRILAAGCILPLSADHALFRERGLGARHLAGLELSEATDAIVLIVSEETGKVSLALGGRLFDAPLLEAHVGGRRTADRWNCESAAH